MFNETGPPYCTFGNVIHLIHLPEFKFKWKSKLKLFHQVTAHRKAQVNGGNVTVS